MTDVLEDAQAYTGHAGRTEIDVDDVKLAIKSRLDHSFTTPPPREVCFVCVFIFPCITNRQSVIRII